MQKSRGFSLELLITFKFKLQVDLVAFDFFSFFGAIP